MTFWLGYAAGFNAGVAFAGGIIVVVLVILYVMYRVTNGWNWGRK